MKTNHLSRRQFLERSAAAAGALLLTTCPWFRAEAAAKRTAVDQVTLGKTGLKLSRLGFGTGSNSGNVQYALGQETFNKLIHYAYDQGITYFDCAQSLPHLRVARRRHQGPAPREAVHPVQGPRQTRAGAGDH